MKIVIAIDSFKGSLTSMEAGQVVMDSIQSFSPHHQTELIPIADGGEGMLSVMMSTTQGILQTLEAHNPCMEKITVNYGISPLLSDSGSTPPGIEGSANEQHSAQRHRTFQF